ncbi:DNA cytosine methyltransferase [Sphingomonas sp. 10B4]|uniref:DNA cytosine methyltransferase n=1 Tax=Sphingomonas sp. 10B4 TaxID=3048575 RepID=UPI002AB37E20|nr:DNA cytosine methyltransferase [Sphingomonas sp. 10B4]MDY7525352.1 DNA cytosine methyltransferase [Sphingomonas sp. 10B4]MEB0284009.1 DNA cytosine methyltransferase [Sphingomonas sp. 10B4]
MNATTGFLAATGLFIDGFAGGGGASTGIAQAIGRDVDIAINHSPSAIAIHKANHPTTEHFCQDIRAVWPLQATRLRPVAGAWFSPDCKEYSKAKGAPVKNRHIRALAGEIVGWLKDVRPTVAYVENVEEFEYAAPLDGHGVPLPDQKGKEFKKLVKSWRAQGYRVEWRVLRACDYGTPTSRKRLYIIMRCDGLPIVWPKPTHGAPGSPGVRSGKLLPYRTAAECIDWSIPCPSIFGRSRELAEATKRRIAAGVVRYVMQRRPFIVDGKLAPHVTKFHSGSTGSPIDKEMPTVTSNGNPARPAGAMPLGLVGAHLEKFSENSRGKSPGDPLDTVMAGATRHGAVETLLAPIITYGQHGGLNRSAEDPHHTIAASKKDTNGVAAVFLSKFATGNDATSLDEPTQTIESKSKHAEVAAFLSTFNGSNTTGGGGEAEAPLKTARAGGQHHSVVAAHMAQFNSNPDGSVNAGHDMRDLVSTVATRGPHQGVIETTLIEEGALPPELLERAVMTAAFLVKYYGEGGQHQTADRPLDVVTTKARYAVVTVTIDAVTYVIVDIGLRMLKPRELARAQGFPEGYVLDPIVRKFVRGKWVEQRLTIAEQISAIGNSVCPPMARALVAANQPGIVDMRMAA